MKKKILSFVLVCAVLLSLTVSAFASGAVLSPQRLVVDGKNIACEKYNIGGSNYFKLRDLAFLLNGTKTQFSVGWDVGKRTVSITTGRSYTPNGSELNVTGPDKSNTAVLSAQTILFDGEEKQSISVYNIGGNNYFKLRDLGDIVGFGVDYDAGTNTVIVDSMPKNGAFLQTIPAYSDVPYVILNDNQPGFSDAEKTTDSYERYSTLDALGRCGAAFANVGTDLMPTQDREEIGMIRPSGWQTVRYDDLIEDKYLYNRCHLIAFCLTGENANEQNLITGTRYFNVSGMLPFETMVAAYVRRTDNHVLYRATPVFYGNQLVAQGVQLEGWSVEDAGKGICFNVFVYNVQPGVEIDYRTGNSGRSENGCKTSDSDADMSLQPGSDGMHYVANLNSKVFHYPERSSVGAMSPKNRQDFYGDRKELINQDFRPCGRCNP